MLELEFCWDIHEAPIRVAVMSEAVGAWSPLHPSEWMPHKYQFAESIGRLGRRPQCLIDSIQAARDDATQSFYESEVRYGCMEEWFMLASDCYCDHKSAGCDEDDL